MSSHLAIAVIHPLPLIDLGLKHLLHQYFDAEVSTYPLGSLFLNDNPDRHELYFVTSELFMECYDFFLPRKNKTVLLTDRPISGSENAPASLCITDNEECIVEKLEYLIDKHCKLNEENNTEELSPREIEVLQLITKGLINKEIADRLNISINTVLSHRKNITFKLGIKTVSGLSLYAMMNGYIHPSSFKE